ncbi:MAG: serine hydrolase [Planctomycetota bacterium]
MTSCLRIAWLAGVVFGVQASCSNLWRNTPLCAQTVAVAESGATGSVDPDDEVAAKQPTEERIRELGEYIERIRQEWAVPGLAVAIVKDDQVLMADGFGHLSIDSEQPVDGDTLFAIASNTKAFTAAALAILVDEGKLAWDDRVDGYLPWLRLKDPMTRDLRVRDLLCHRSGLGTFSGDLVWWGTKYSPREVLERAIHLQPASSFRSKYGYSNLMFLAAGLVIEEVSGQPWSEFVSQRILEPLNMSRTITTTSRLDEVGNFATPHKTFLDRNQPIEWVNWDNMAAAGGVISSAKDMANWMRVQLGRGEYAGNGSEPLTLFSKTQSHQMWRAHTPITVSEASIRKMPSTHFRAYGLGWSLSDYRGCKLAVHGGGYDGMYSQTLLVPEKNLGVIVLTNSMTSITSSITYRVLDSFLGGEMRDWSTERLEDFRKSRESFARRITAATKLRAEGTKPSHDLKEYTGGFRCPLYGDAKVELEGDGLVLRLLPNERLVADLEHLHYDTFQLHWRHEHAWFGSGTANFQSDARGEIVQIELDVPNDDMWFYELDLQRSAVD